MITQIKKMITLIRMGLVVVLLLSLASTAFAEEKKKVKTASTMKELQGEITWMSDKYIAIVYNRDLTKGAEEEILLPIDSNIQLQHKRNLAELSAGDTVSIEYQEDSEEDEIGNRKESRKAKIIRFIRPGKKKADTQQSVESEAFSLKGLKGE